MREIKFRAWDIEKEAMDKSYRFFEAGDIIPKHWSNSRFIVTQYTGLKDKNGKEIYEGDILSSEYKSIGSKRDCHPVEWRDGSWIVNHSINDCCKPWRGNLSGHHRSEEIIGNIYENPGLLA